jgi:hypothetical protein
MAAPHVAGAWAILLQKDPDATLAELLTILKNTGVAVTDTRAGANSRATPRIQVDAALSVLNEAPVITQGISTTVTMSEDGSPTDFELELNASDADNDPLTWSISSDPDHGSATISDGAGMAEEISYIPDADYVGSDSFDVQVSDEDGDTDTITVNVTMQAVNDAPTFTRGPDVVVPITSTAQTVPQWANNIRPGPASASDELSQTLTFTLEVTSTTGSLAFATDPAIDPSSGDLTFQATAGTTGTATVLVRLRDSGPGTTPHSNTSLAEQFRIIVGQDVPSGNIDDIVVYVNAADTVINLYDAFSDPNDADADLSFAVHKNTNASLVGTSIDTSAGTLTLQYVSGSRGTATITVRATDPDGNYADAVFRVTVVQGLNVYIPLVVR